jgi:hypothetical protein
MIHSIQYTIIVYKYVALYPLEHLDNRKIMKGGRSNRGDKTD